MHGNDMLNLEKQFSLGRKGEGLEGTLRSLPEEMLKSFHLT